MQYLKPINALLFFFLTSLFIVLFGWTGSCKFGSVMATIEWMRGENILVDKRQKDLGLVKFGSMKTISYQLFNNTKNPIKILGVQTSCSCTIVDRSQVVIASGELKTITASIDLSTSESSALNGSLTLYTDDPATPSLNLGFSGRISGR